MLLASVGLAGHVFPILGLAAELRRRNHAVAVETSTRWRDEVERLGCSFIAATESIAKPGSEEPGRPTLAEAARRSEVAIREFGAAVVVADLFTLAPALGAELAGVPRATVIHHPFPLSAPGQPPFPLGIRPPRTALGRGFWRLLDPLLELRFRPATRRLNAAREELGLPGFERPLGAISDELAIVATFPQLEYPRRWPSHVHVTGPLHFHPEVTTEPRLPDGDGPLVVVAASTAQDERQDLVRQSLEALAAEPVRVLVTTGGHRIDPQIALGSNAATAEWLSFPSLLPSARAMITHGGHGTLAAGLSHGVPLVVCPEGADQPENATRVEWAGAGVALGRRRRNPKRIRDALGRLLDEPRFAEAAARFSEWDRGGRRGAIAAAELVEGYALR